MNMHVSFLLVAWIVGMASVLGLTFFPITFWLFIIPKIQKRAGKKFLYNPKLYVYPILSKYLAYIDVAWGISVKYVGVKYFGDQKKFKLDSRRPLETVTYDVTQASKFEVFFSFFSVLNWAFLFIALITGAILLAIAK